MFYLFWLRLLTPLAKLIFPFQIKGAENIPRDGKLIVCSNHKSLIDPFLLAVPFHRPIRFMAKSELFLEHGALARWLLYQMGAFPVRRGKGDTGSIKTALKILEQGGVVGIFPQGKCVFDNAPFQPKAGAVMIALKAHAPILPASIYCDGIIKPFRPITVRFGEVISYETLAQVGGGHKNIRDASLLLSRRINTMLEEKG
ncbi:lysophospholipid acyltransferase family protein [Caproiciproducens sp. LBM24188]|jgi:1-acyl-sn-glycerol-3-phosphate acyltransferase|nr:1-acyl-sn-glycerol-3-phosphate acyltransferase [Oscillospiraceae bacterium]HHV32100.1 1-acyl-sn-glycerol-3-phosphate acyltransferase [Clostridiales bacterium]